MVTDATSSRLARTAALFGPPAIAPRHGTMLDALFDGAHAASGAFHFCGSRAPVELSFESLREGAFRWARTLVASGARRGDRVPLLLSTGPDFLQAFFGTMVAGAVPVPLAAPMTFGSLTRYLANLRAIVADADAHVLVTTPRVRDAIAADELLRTRLRDVITEPVAGRSGATRVPACDPRDTAFIQYTSGTTGSPKGVVVSHAAAVSNALAIANGLGIRGTDVGVSWLPLFHDMGLIGAVLTAVVRPYPVYLLPPEAFVMRPQQWLALAAERRATMTVGPNFAFDFCVSRATAPLDGSLESLRVVLNGSEPVQPETVRRFERRFASNRLSCDAMLPVYGMAENTLAVTFSTPGAGLRTLRVQRERFERSGHVVPSDSSDALECVSVGTPVAGTNVRVVSDGRVADVGIVGEVEVQGSSCMDGYFRNDEATSSAIRDGWLRTGDLGFVHGDTLHLVGRSKDVIIKSGRNVYPHDVERIVYEVEGVRRGAAVAFGRRNAETGTEDIVVVAEVAARGSVDKDALVRAIRGEVLAALGVRLDAVLLAPAGSLPRTTSGKIQRGACASLVSAEGDGACGPS